MRRRLHLACIAILVLGLTSAGLIFALAEEAPEAAASYRIVDGQVYTVPQAASRKYVSQLERFGGKPAVLFDELIEWFWALWRGRRLAFTVGWLSVLGALGVYLYAQYLTPHPGRENGG
jgi:hypothetical protein